MPAVRRNAVGVPDCWRFSRDASGGVTGRVPRPLQPCGPGLQASWAPCGAGGDVTYVTATKQSAVLAQRELVLLGRFLPDSEHKMLSFAGKQ
jgi:hypothetical protein